MLSFVFKKIIKNIWLYLCLLLGFVLVIAVVCEIPVYTNAVLNKMLQNDLIEQYNSTGKYPGSYEASTELIWTEANPDAGLKREAKADEMIQNRLLPSVPLDIVTEQYRLESYRMILAKNDETLNVNAKQFNRYQSSMYQLGAVADIEDHIEFVYGEMNAPYEGGKRIEIILTEKMMIKSGLTLGKENRLYNYIARDEDPYIIVVTGVFKAKDATDPFWFNDYASLDGLFLMDYDGMKNILLPNSPMLTGSMKSCIAFDYTQITLENFDTVYSALSKNQTEEKGVAVADIAMLSVLNEYLTRQQTLVSTLWVVQVPLISMIFMYIYMISTLIVDYDRNELAVLRSRGISTGQVFRIYLYKGVIIGGIAYTIAIPLSLLLCRVTGASNGFLEFIGRAPLDVSLNSDAVLYSVASVIMMIGLILLSVMTSKETSVVAHKQSKIRGKDTPLWKKTFFDVILIGVSLYGLFSYRSNREFLQTVATENATVPVDPLMFLISTFFIIGAGLFFIRIYPMILKLATKLVGRRLPPPEYMTMLNITRANGKNILLMLFLIFTVSMGIFNSVTARTLNSNAIDEIYYHNGADIVITPYWQAYDIEGAPYSSMSATSSEGMYYLSEPATAAYSDLDAVESYTKVLTRKYVSIDSADHSKGGVGAVVMGVLPDQFAQTVEFRDGILPYHLNNYLNLLAKVPNGAVISTKMSTDFGINAGDAFYAQWGNNDSYLEFVALAVVDYWPTFDPYQTYYFFAANLSYIQAESLLEPYDIWVKKSEGATTAELYEQMDDAGLTVRFSEDSTAEVINAKNDPLLKGINGSLTLSFMITMAISATGFLIYWLLAIREKFLQFGVLRSMGFSKFGVFRMLFCEQIFISVAYILAGVLIGNLAATLFVPLLSMATDITTQIPPFVVTVLSDDLIRLLGAIGAMIAICLTVFGVMISRMKIYETLKMGED